MSSENRLEAIIQQPWFSRVNFNRLITLSYLLSFIIFLLLGTIYYQYFTRPAPHYFATTSDGRLIELTPVNVNQ